MTRVSKIIVGVLGALALLGTLWLLNSAVHTEYSYMDSKYQLQTEDVDCHNLFRPAKEYYASSIPQKEGRCVVARQNRQTQAGALGLLGTALVLVAGLSRRSDDDVYTGSWDATSAEDRISAYAREKLERERLAATSGSTQAVASNASSEASGASPAASRPANPSA